MLSDQLVDQPQAFRLVGSQHPAGQHDLHGLKAADLPGRAGAAAETGVDTQPDFREAQPCRLVFGSNPVVEAQGQFKSAAQAVAIDQ